MALRVEVRVRDTSTTTGTGTITVSGTAPTGYRTLSAVLSVADTFPYTIAHQTANEWEVGLGTYSAANQFTRTTIYYSSNTDAAVNFSAGTKDVMLVHTANPLLENSIDIAAGGRYLYGGTNAISGMITEQNWFFAVSGNFTMTGTANTVVGNNSLLANTTGSRNMGFGAYTLESNTEGVDNVAVGTTALQENTTGSYNVAIGSRALEDSVDGASNVAIGYNALVTGTSSDRNVAIGFNTLFSASNERNTGVGGEAGYSLSSGASNTLIGNGAGYSLTTGTRNIVIGASCEAQSNTADNQLCIGNYIYGTGLSSTGTTISSAKIGLGVKAPACELDVGGLVRTLNYTVATLPSASSGLAGARAYVTDATAPTFLGALTGGGSVVCPVFCNGTAWVAG